MLQVIFSFFGIKFDIFAFKSLTNIEHSAILIISGKLSESFETDSGDNSGESR